MAEKISLYDTALSGWYDLFYPSKVQFIELSDPGKLLHPYKAVL